MPRKYGIIDCDDLPESMPGKHGIIERYIVLGLAAAVAMSFCSVILAAAGYIAKVW